MLALSYFLSSLWSWFLGTGIDLIIIVLIGALIPRIGRLVMRIVRKRIESTNDEEAGKNKLAFAGVGLYIIQIVAYFILIVTFLQQLGFSLAGAAIPATVASAAVGFGAQSIVADFLAGFFILTEKQFGVGDWVRFEGGGVEAEGTVVEVTMRATTIRTISQQTIIVPNSAAKVCINSSNEWSRAVVVMPVPMLGSEDIGEVIARSEGAARRALAEEQVSAVVLGELDVHPAVDIQPPTVVGMPWMVTMRFMIQVTAGNQWLVERAVRTQIIDEFWDEYGSATTVTGALVDKLTLDDHPGETPTGLIPTPTPDKAYSRKPVIDVPVDALDEDSAMAAAVVSAGAGGAVAGRHLDTTASAETAEVTADGEVKPTAQGTHPNRPDISMSVPPKNMEDADETRVFPVTDDPADTDNSEDDDQNAGSRTSLFRSESYDKWWQRLLSGGGRIRMSTGAMTIALVLLLLFKVFTIEPEEGWEGWNTSNEEEITTPVESVPEPVISEEPALSTEPPAPTTESTADPTGTATPIAPGATNTPTTAPENEPAPTVTPTTVTPTPGLAPRLQQTPTPAQPTDQAPAQSPAQPTAEPQPAPVG
ncbi:transporter, small conductance mechanosensitive ion channel MscS family protein [Corynebacterium efficiens YS-314]|uniref:Mechanosensitive ion channel MscS domain-containing protein n=1 Tax=Corynebacterium efficiens (strain DSM 44549 / YS-314 / AJ 12310 / JCM 11189 / NBRC 100395) TaxID=196164 RepID=Q8FPX4_COREF|nr:mechanosensitive ion channel family protein [Corynebacterium efficiens]EEW50648.1 transporter, small conductance mechanosensitive ion channel MscS family protein [Corynebacterium efficiens YS-314]BAC18174.1 conserved hypothetical protein [Corynebacterium efficiens YS-314]